MSARRQIVAALSEDSLGGIATMQDVEHAEQLVDALIAETFTEAVAYFAANRPQPGGSDFDRGRRAAFGWVMEELQARAGEKATDPTATAAPDFFEADRTYAVNDGLDRIPTLDWIFTVEAIGQEPDEHGRRVAFGYLGNRAGRQATAHIESAESWSRGWTDITDTTTGDNT